MKNIIISILATAIFFEHFVIRGTTSGKALVFVMMVAMFISLLGYIDKKLCRGKRR